MKRLFCIILALMIGLSLCACGEKEVTNQDTDELSKGEKLYKRYKDIIEFLEDEDYAGAISAIEDMAKNPTQGSPSPETTEGGTESTPGNEQGSQSTVYIHNSDELFGITDSAEKTYILANDIDLRSVSKTLEEFHGTLDGNGMVIRNSSQPLVKTNKGTIGNITVENCDIQADGDAAAIVINNDGTVVGCSVSGSITSKTLNAYAGGVVCHNSGTIDNCVNNATVYAESWQLNELGNVIHGTWACAGGVIAYNSGNVSRCVNHGSVDATGADYISSAGGIISANTGGEIKNCYNTGNINSDNDGFLRGGGIAGFSDFGKFLTCYNVGQANSGIVGDNRDYIIDCYYLDSVSSNGSGSGLNTEGERIHSFSTSQLTSESTFAAFDFETVWVMTAQGPQLR